MTMPPVPSITPLKLAVVVDALLITKALLPRCTTPLLPASVSALMLTKPLRPLTSNTPCTITLLDVAMLPVNTKSVSASISKSAMAKVAPLATVVLPV